LVWLRLGGQATLEDKTDLENVHEFFQLLDQFDDGDDLKDHDEFISQMDNYMQQWISLLTIAYRS